MSWFELISEEYVFSFFLLFARITALFATMPIFNHQSLSVQVKAAFAFYLTVILFPFAEITQVEPTLHSILTGLFFEIVFAVIAGLALTIVMLMLMYAAEIMSFIMGFSMASAMDPVSGVNSPILGIFITLVAILTLLQINAHHYMIMFMADSINQVPLGSFLLTDDIVQYFINAMSNFFVMGFTIAFPIVALAYISDVIFGMLMKTMPQFNLLVVGFPIKITVSLIIIIATLGSMITVFKREFYEAFEFLYAIM